MWGARVVTGATPNSMAMKLGKQSLVSGSRYSQPRTDDLTSFSLLLPASIRDASGSSMTEKQLLVWLLPSSGGKCSWEGFPSKIQVWHSCLELWVSACNSQAACMALAPVLGCKYSLLISSLLYYIYKKRASRRLHIMVLKILQTGTNPKDFDGGFHWMEVSHTHLFWLKKKKKKLENFISVEQGHLPCLGAGIWEQLSSHCMAWYGMALFNYGTLHLREWGQLSQCSKIQTKTNPTQGLTRETQSSWEIFGPLVNELPFWYKLISHDLRQFSLFVGSWGVFREQKGHISLL